MLAKAYKYQGHRLIGLLPVHSGISCISLQKRQWGVTCGHYSVAWQCGNTPWVLYRGYPISRRLIKSRYVWVVKVLTQ